MVNSKINPKESLNKRTVQINSITQRDSSYFWLWDTNINNWSVEPFSKIINTADSSILKNWNGNHWIVKQCFFATFDGFNNVINNGAFYWNGNFWGNGYKYS